MALRIYELQIDEWNKREYAAHGVSTDEVFQVLDKGPVFLRNSKGHAATILMIGPTGGGRLLTIPLQPINEQEGLWRPATAFDARPVDLAYYAKGGAR